MKIKTPQSFYPRVVRLQPTSSGPVRKTDRSSIRPFNIPACTRLVGRAFALHELPSLIEAIFSNKDGGNTVNLLQGDDAQTFVNVIDEVRSLLREIWMIKVDVNKFYQ